jgi:ankyrin repeat protein
MASGANDRLCRAAARGDVADIAAALLAGAGPNAFEGTAAWTPLLRASSRGHVAAIAALLSAGAHVNCVDRDGTTPLMWAAGNGHTATVDVLLVAGADVQHTSINGNTALHRASAWCQLGVARVLLEAGARTGVRNKYGKRPIDEVRAPARAVLLPLRDFVTVQPRPVAMRRFGIATMPLRPPSPPC